MGGHDVTLNLKFSRKLPGRSSDPIGFHVAPVHCNSLMYLLDGEYNKSSYSE